MVDLQRVAAACGVLIRAEVSEDGTDNAASGFEHLGTAWTLGDGSWYTIWTAPQAPGPQVQLLPSSGGEPAAISGWEADEESPVAGFTSVASATGLELADAEASALGKRQFLSAVGYPSVIDHPSFKLHRPSLTPERYVPYLCPWQIDGHLSLFTIDEGFIGGRFFGGMQGGPVLNAAGAVVGMLIDGAEDPAVLPLTRFRRLL